MDLMRVVVESFLNFKKKSLWNIQDLPTYIEEFWSKWLLCQIVSRKDCIG
ncbi:hypothetical protein RO3G_07335 [Rhizopus delemar RA 99-880]|uniref:Uncharacterized protein n=1 Tax=Rhizopus delemar (strain RA 99-880 / ATCC MYA-4621 / FGSC 9543 / NRRL 43880) TaxID=246409 RepID=I1C2F0_RHIO9|nr:hypothetical protein RO3G_07335 [Rhizopus delemar RA 99-880]|eukprot:EIE82630.1 hypothetical protein RO3G_07335 [Rhizopus delemar RA 99-880]